MDETQSLHTELVSNEGYATVLMSTCVAAAVGDMSRAMIPAPIVGRAAGTGTAAERQALE